MRHRREFHLLAVHGAVSADPSGRGDADVSTVDREVALDLAGQTERPASDRHVAADPGPGGDGCRAALLDEVAADRSVDHEFTVLDDDVATDGAPQDDAAAPDDQVAPDGAVDRHAAVEDDRVGADGPTDERLARLLDDII